MRSSHTRPSEHRQETGTKRDRSALWSGYNPYFPPVNPDGAGDRAPRPSSVLFDPYFPARKKP